MSVRTQKTRFVLKLRYLAEAAAFFTVIGFFRLFHIDAASAIGGFFGRHVLYRTSISDRARGNLRAAYPDKSDAEIALMRALKHTLDPNNILNPGKLLPQGGGAPSG